MCQAATLHGSGRRHDRAKPHESQSSCCQRHPSRAWVDNIGNIDYLRTRGSLGAWRTTGSRDGVANAAIRQDAGRCEVHRPRQSRQGTRCDEAKANVDVGGWRRCGVKPRALVTSSTPGPQQQAAAATGAMSVDMHASEVEASGLLGVPSSPRTGVAHGGRDSDGNAKVKPSLILFAFHNAPRLGTINHE